MSVLVNEISVVNDRHAPLHLLRGLLRLIDAGGCDLKVAAYNGWEVTGNPVFHGLDSDELRHVDAVALWFGERECEGTIAENCEAAAKRLAEAGKTLAIVGPKRNRICAAAQASARWIVY